MANAWFRMYSEFADDPKVQMMSEAMQRRLLMLMCSKCKDETLHETELAFHWRVSETELAETKAVFISKEFIDENWELLNWNKRQFISDSSTDRSRRFRQRKKQDETLHETDATKGNVSVTAPEQNRTEQNREKVEFNLPDWINPDTWQAYLEVRKSKRAAKTANSWRLVVKQLETFRAKGHDANAILETSVRSNWADVYLPKGPAAVINTPQSDALADVRERNRKALEEVQRAG